MALVSFGGGGDPSGLFASLNRQHLQDIEALAERATSRANERSDAADREMFDKWQNGLIDDDAWLEYIQDRVEETAGDPKEHQQWIEAQREYTTSIADNKMEFAYENGQATINQIIEYYRDRLGDMDKDSQAYREISGRLNQYLDKRSGDDIQAGAQDITDRIVMGRASIGDLIGFYRQRLGGLRKNSSLYEQIQQEIRDLQSQQIQQNYSGGGSGGGGGGGGRRYRSSGGRSSGGGGDWGSTSSQYAAATASGIVPRSDVVSAALMERDATGVSGQARAFGGTLPGMSEVDSDDFIQGARAHAGWMLDQFADENSDSIITDPNTGMEWENTPENAQIWAYEYIDLSEMRARGQETGNKTDASNARFARNDIGEAVLTAQRANAIPVEEAGHRVYAEYRRQLNIAEQSGDPVNVMRVNSTFGHEFEKLGEQAIVNTVRTIKGRGRNALVSETKKLRPGVERAPENLAEEFILRGQLLSAYGSGDAQRISDAQTKYRALEDHEFDLVDTGPEIWGDLDAGIAPAGSSPATVSVVAARLRMGELEGSYVRIYDPQNPGNGIAVVPASVQTIYDPVTGQNVGQRTPMSANFNPANGDRWERIYTDDRNGNPVETWVISRLEDLPISTFVAGNGFEFNGQKLSAGTALTESVIGDMDDSEIQSAIADGRIKMASAGQVRTYTYRYGNHSVKAYWNEEIQAWTDIPYIRQGLNLRAAGGQMAVILRDDMSLGGHLRAYGHLQSRPIQYHGNNPQKFQQMINNGQIDIPHWGYKVDETGVVTPEENDFRDYWYDERLRTQSRGFMINGSLVQWADPHDVEHWKTVDRSMGLLTEEMRDPKDRTQPPSAGETLVTNWSEQTSLGEFALGGIMGAFGIFSGDPNKSKTMDDSRFGAKESQVAGLSKSAFARVQAAERERARREAAPRIRLPNIPLPRRTGTITPRTKLPDLPTVRAGINVGGEKRPISRSAPAPAPRRTVSRTAVRTPYRAPTPTRTTTTRRLPNSGGARVT